MSMGEVMVYLRGLWGAVCADNFTDAAADSVCRQLGYTVSNDHYQERYICLCMLQLTFGLGTNLRFAVPRLFLNMQSPDHSRYAVPRPNMI